MNARNLRYIRPANTKQAVNLANNKLASKQALLDAKLPTANLHGVIKNRKELLTFDWMNLPKSFVLKPTYGLGGEGILVIFGQKKPGVWIASGDQDIYVKDMINHCSNILDGNFSLSNIPDIAFFEERLQLNSEFKKISWQGIPDIRIIVFNNVPIMAMLRLPTKESDGKANLHQGGIGVGIDLTTGITTFATQNDQPIDKHPDTNNNLQGFAIPYWDDILKISISAAQTINLGYSGIDIVIDRDKGPVILEVNGHPGLSIQNANLTTLKDRLDRVSGLDIKTVAKGIKVAKSLFIQTTETTKDKTEEDDKKILGFIETIEVSLPDNKTETIRAKINTDIASTTMNRQLAIKLGFRNIINNFEKLIDNKENFPAAYIKNIEEQINKKNQPSKTGIASIVGVKKGDAYILRPKINLAFNIKNQSIKTQVAIAHTKELSYPLVIGRNDLKKFLIDPSKSLTT